MAAKLHVGMVHMRLVNLLHQIRLWRLVKYEHFYLRSDDSIADLEAGLKTYFDFFNQKRTHQLLARRTPDEVYFADRLRKAT